MPNYLYQHRLTFGLITIESDEPIRSPNWELVGLITPVETKNHGSLCSNCIRGFPLGCEGGGCSTTPVETNRAPEIQTHEHWCAYANSAELKCNCTPVEEKTIPKQAVKFTSGYVPADMPLTIDSGSKEIWQLKTCDEPAAIATPVETESSEVNCCGRYRRVGKHTARCEKYDPEVDSGVAKD